MEDNQTGGLGATVWMQGELQQRNVWYTNLKYESKGLTKHIFSRWGHPDTDTTAETTTQGHIRIQGCAHE